MKRSNTSLLMNDSQMIKKLAKSTLKNTSNTLKIYGQKHPIVQTLQSLILISTNIQIK